MNFHLRTRLRELLAREKIDPILQRLERVVRVAAAAGIGDEIYSAKFRALGSIVRRHGLNVRVLHTVQALLHPDRLALCDERRRVTYQEADREINRLAHALANCGVGPGSSVALATENRVEYVLTWFALFRLGARAVHASYRMTPSELEYLVRHSGAVVLLVSKESVAAARSVRDAIASKPTLVVCDGEVDRTRNERSYEEFVRRGADAMPKRPTRGGGGSVVYTSGTTGKPKGAVRDFAAFGPEELVRVMERLPFRFGEKHLVVAPLYHSAPQVFTLITTALGGTVHLLAHFDPQATLLALEEHDISSIFLVPTMLRRLLELPSERLDRARLSSVRAVVVGSAEFPPPLREAAIKRFGATAVFDFYGATELGWVTLIRGDEMRSFMASVGRPLAGQQIRILDREGLELPVGEVGLVYVENAQTMQGYLHDAEASRATRRDGWVTVEDLGSVNRAGYLFLAGRARDMVKSGGVNVYPAEIEAVLHRDPAIADVAVIGVPDPEWGERLVGIVVLRKPLGESAFDAAAVEQRAREHLSSLKVPRRWEIVDELPRNPTGKVLKNELRARFAPTVSLSSESRGA